MGEGWRVAALIAAIMALGAGAALGRAGGGAPRRRSFVEGAVISLVGGLAALHLAPHAIHHGGAWGALALVAGLVLPGLGHRLGVEGLWSIVGLALLAAHAAMDGAALAVPEPGMGASFAVAVIAHRVPEGLAVADRAGHLAPDRAWPALGALAAATVGGFLAGEQIFARVPEAVHGSLEGIVAGALLHVVLGHRGAGAERTWTVAGFATGAVVVGLVVLAAGARPHGP